MKKILLLIMALCLTGVVQAQVPQNKDVYAYVEAGKTGMYLFYFVDGAVYKSERTGKGLIKTWYQKDPTFLSYFKLGDVDERTDNKFLYDSTNSTNKRVTYYYHQKASGGAFSRPENYWYLSFSKDRETLIYWSAQGVKYYYKRVEISDIVTPKAMNKDFLYE